jgi:hypothetical protein
VDCLHAFKCKRFRNTRHTVTFGILLYSSFLNTLYFFLPPTDVEKIRLILHRTGGISHWRFDMERLESEPLRFIRVFSIFKSERLRADIKLTID